MEEYVQLRINSAMQRNPRANRSVLEFIFNFWFAAGTDIASQNTIITLFLHGYCYYFALMLKDAFQDGEICWAAPFGHIVFLYQGLAYDIEGLYAGESDLFVPVSRLGRAIDDFRHVPGVQYNATDQEIARIMVEYREEQKKTA